MFMHVDLPEPLGPMTATNSPASMRRSMPRSVHAARPPYVFRHAAQFDDRRRMSPRFRPAARRAPRSFRGLQRVGQHLEPRLHLPPTICAMRPSVAPTTTAMATGASSFRTHTC
jgi:hypothetical protein